MKIEDHLEAFKQHKESIFEWAVSIRGLENAQRIVGLHASRGIAELLSALLHEQNKIDPGFQLNHTWFKSEKLAKEKLPKFDKDEVIVKKLVQLENSSENLAYGKPKSESEIKKTIDLFRELEDIISKLMKHE